MMLPMVMRWVLIPGLLPNCYFTLRSSDNKGNPTSSSRMRTMKKANGKVVSEFGRKCDLEAIQAKGRDSYSQGARNSLINTNTNGAGTIYRRYWPKAMTLVTSFLFLTSSGFVLCLVPIFVGSLKELLFHQLANKFIEALSLALICDKTGTWMAPLSPLIRSLILPSNS